MNKLEGTISEINTSGNIHLVSVEVMGETFLSLIITKDHYVKEGNKIYLIFKESEVPVSKDRVENISISNSFSALITKIEKGNILSKINLDFKGKNLLSLITTRKLESMNLNRGDTVYFFIKASEIILMDFQ
jgi:molybdate transport system regulatory protein